MVAFVDTSALLKLYVEEIGSRWMQDDVRPLGIAMSELAVAEVGVSLSRRNRDGRLTDRQAREAWRLFRREIRGFLVTPLDRRGLIGAGFLAARSPVILRTLDAIHLRGARETAADALRMGGPAPLFVSADLRLLRAAAALGFPTESPEDHP